MHIKVHILYRESIMADRTEWSSPEWVCIQEITSDSKWFLWNINSQGWSFARIHKAPPSNFWRIIGPECCAIRHWGLWRVLFHPWLTKFDHFTTKWPMFSFGSAHRSTAIVRTSGRVAKRCPCARRNNWFYWPMVIANWLRSQSRQPLQYHWQEWRLTNELHSSLRACVLALGSWKKQRINHGLPC